jgi:hypothetical protein
MAYGLSSLTCDATTPMRCSVVAPFNRAAVVGVQMQTFRVDVEVLARSFDELARRFRRFVFVHLPACDAAAVQVLDEVQVKEAEEVSEDAPALS